jgi:antitoxin ParD1/3/4
LDVIEPADFMESMMENITIPLPTTLKDFVDAETSARGFSSPGEYIQAMLREEQKRKLDAKVQALIEKGLASESMEWNAQALGNMKDEISRRHSQRQGT